MPLNIQDTTYAGEASAGFKVRALTGADTVQGGHVYIQDGIKKKFTIMVMKVDDAVQDRVATPSTVTDSKTKVSGQVLEPADYMIYDEFNPRDFEQHWLARQLNPELIDRMLPPTAEGVIIGEHMKLHSKFIEKIIWQGDTTRTDNLKYFDGFIKKAFDSSDVLKVTSGLAALTASNIGDKLNAVHALIPEALLYDQDMKFFVSYKTGQLYREYQQAQTYKGVDITSEGVMRINGKRVVPVAGMPNDTIFCAKGTPDQNSNLWIGMNSTADEDTIKLSPLQANSELWFVKILMKLDAQIGLPEEVVLYHLDN